MDVPARVIRSEINSSDSLSRVSLLADLFFRALLLECDDFGRFDGRPQILKAALFPLRAEYTPEVIQACVDELASGEDPALRVFFASSRPYLLLTGWERHRGKGKRAERSKYPDPPQESAPRKRSPRISADLRGSPGGSARLTSDVLRLTSDDDRGTTIEGRCGGEPPASPAAARAADACPQQVEIEPAWERAQEAFGDYGKRPRELPPARRKLLRSRLREYPGRAMILTEAVHGYMAFHACPSGDFDPLAHLTPETVYRPSNVAKYLEAYDRALESGRSPPFRLEARAAPKTFGQLKAENTRAAITGGVALLRGERA